MQPGSGGVPTRQRGFPKCPAVLGWVAAGQNGFLQFAEEPNFRLMCSMQLEILTPTLRYWAILNRCPKRSSDFSENLKTIAITSPITIKTSKDKVLNSNTRIIKPSRGCVPPHTAEVSNFTHLWHESTPLCYRLKSRRGSRPGNTTTQALSRDMCEHKGSE